MRTQEPELKASERTVDERRTREQATSLFDEPVRRACSEAFEQAIYKATANQILGAVERFYWQNAMLEPPSVKHSADCISRVVGTVVERRIFGKKKRNESNLVCKMQIGNG